MKLTISAPTGRALQGSIEKWERVVNTGAMSYGPQDCPLCHLFNSAYPDRNSLLTCEDCPIGRDTEERGCEGTPHATYARAPRRSEEEKAAAKEMLAYLRDLQGRCEVTERPMLLLLVIDLDERGEFSAHVEDEACNTVFSYENDEEGVLSLVEDGFMKHGLDKSGLLSYLIDAGFVDKSARWLS